MEFNNQSMASGLTSPQKQLSQTGRALVLADDNSRMLMDSISLLVEKLNPILRSPQPTTTGGECEKSDFYLEETGKPKQRGFVSGLKGEWKKRSRKHLFVKKF